MPKGIDPALRERALRMVADHRSDYPSVTVVAVHGPCAAAKMLDEAGNVIHRGLT